MAMHKCNKEMDIAEIKHELTSFNQELAIINAKLDSQPTTKQLLIGAGSLLLAVIPVLVFCFSFLLGNQYKAVKAETQVMIDQVIHPQTKQVIVSKDTR